MIITNDLTAVWWYAKKVTLYIMLKYY